MKVSVIMCAYNASAFIDKAIQSIIAQTYTDWELIICDDRSKDDTIAIINRYTGDARIRLYEQPVNVGYIKNKNFGFRQATGSLLTQLDADDVCDATRLEKQVSALQSHPEIKICGTNYQTIDPDDNTMACKSYSEDFLVTELSMNYPFWFPGLMFYKELVQEFGLFSEYFHGIYGDDYHWTLRVNEKYPVYFIREPLYHYRVHADSLTNFYDDNNRKLIADDILAEIYRQHKATGTDMLEAGEPEKMKAFEQKLFADRTVMAEKYRVWAAKAINGQYWDTARRLLKKSFSLSKTNLNYYRTLAYYIRSKRKQMPIQA